MDGQGPLSTWGGGVNFFTIILGHLKTVTFTLNLIIKWTNFVNFLSFFPIFYLSAYFFQILDLFTKKGPQTKSLYFPIFLLCRSWHAKATYGIPKNLEVGVSSLSRGRIFWKNHMEGILLSIYPSPWPSLGQSYAINNNLLLVY
jgi:hypothetical protein